MRFCLFISAFIALSCTHERPARPVQRRMIYRNIPPPLTLYLQDDPRMGYAQRSVHDSVDQIDRSNDSAQKVLDAIGATNINVRSASDGGADQVSDGGTESAPVHTMSP